MTTDNSAPPERILELHVECGSNSDIVRLPVSLCGRITAVALALARSLANGQHGVDARLDAMARACALLCSDVAVLLSLDETFDENLRRSMMSSNGSIGLFFGIVETVRGRDSGWGETTICHDDGMTRFLSYWAELPYSNLEQGESGYVPGVAQRALSLNRVLRSTDDFDIIPVSDYVRDAAPLGRKLLQRQIKSEQDADACSPPRHATLH